jgi:hypothetical protein
MTLSTNILLFADRSRFGNLGEAFRSHGDAVDRTEVMWGLVFLTALVVMLWLVSRWLKRRQRAQPYNSPRRLFFGLCRAHGLRWSDRWLLWRVAKWQRLKDPGRLFLEPQRFEEANLGPLRASAPRLKAIRQRLFIEPAKETQPVKEKEEERPSASRPMAEAARGQPPRPTPLAPVPAPPTLDLPWSAAGSAPAFGNTPAPSGV